ncbi:SlyX family protein [Nitrogeniibacter mangrovi]|uniref:SlyX family protein n=1 Tax=Nitrogeniibacter mangrovi TaxID=2016596 RepID=A0A6C1B5M7_9RHOO|nr:SlyX family protein [Nitrogeniibacter mangrovi]
MRVDQRIEGVECKLMGIEDQVETLNLTVFRQQQRIERLERQLAELAQLVRSREPETPRRLEDDIPPHY